MSICVWVWLDHLKASQGKNDGIWSALWKISKEIADELFS